jgi:N-acetylmuramoyl-L-alanine amidase
VNWPSNWFNAWIPLESWSQFNGLEKPLRLSVEASPTFQVRSAQGAMDVTVGRRTLSCGGLECWLNQPPQLINGTPYVHWLDARKTLQPLISNPAIVNGHQPTIVIDPGHGGRDGGTRSCLDGSFEKDYTLDWAVRLRPLLQQNGWKVVLTRTNDIDLALINRVALAEQTRADLFLSLHFNSGEPNRELAGVETFCLTPTGMVSHLSRGYDDDPRQVYPNNAFDDQNLQVAFALHRAVLEQTRAADRGLRRARFMTVLRGQNRPAVLIEAGYLSNPGEARQIATPAYRQALAEAVAKAVYGLHTSASAASYAGDLPVEGRGDALR